MVGRSNATIGRQLAGQMLKHGSESEAVWAVEAGTTQLVKKFNAQLMSPSVEDSSPFFQPSSQQCILKT